MKYFVVDAFAEHVFGGNPAGVCVLEKPMDAELMQRIAAENNLSETAFVYRREMGKYDLKWFTPKAEIDLCGHATLGTAYVVANFVDRELTVVRKGAYFEMDFPSRMPKQIPVTQEMEEVIGMPIAGAYLSRDLVLELENEAAVKNCVPDFEKMLHMEQGLGCVVTAKGSECDFVSRCFFPKLGVNEDPVTGSAHSSLIPFWAERLEKKELMAEQWSERGGKLLCVDDGERVKIAGKAVLYLQGELLLEK